MTLNEIKQKIKTDEYDFIRTNPHLGKNVILLTLGGSYAYGTNHEESDIDIRGIALNTKEEILLGNDFEQVVESNTDTTIYSFKKIVKLLLNCNPNTIEILGCKPEHYLYLSPIGKEILDNKNLFLSKKAINSFCGYANSQLRRLSNKSARLISQEEQEQHILSSIKYAEFDYKERYFPHDDSAIKLYVDKSQREDIENEIYMDINLYHYPLRDYTGMWSEMKNVVRDYDKVGKRNERAMSHDKISKHMMHLFRLYLMCLDILEKGEINTYRDKEHDFLMSVRNDNYIDENRQPIPEVFDMVDEFEKKVQYAKEHTNLPDEPNYKKVNEFIMSVNERIVKGELQ